MRRAIPALVAVLVLFAATGVSAAPTSPPDDLPSSRGLGDTNNNRIADALEHILAGGPETVDVVVTLNEAHRASEFWSRTGPFTIGTEFTLINGFSATMRASQVHALAASRAVFRVEPDVRVASMNEEANTDFGTAQARSDFGLTGTGISICILDTGVDSGHEQLDGGKVAGFIEFYPSTIAGPGSTDDQGHGSHVANTAAGNANPNGGVAPGAAILSAKVLDSAGSGSESIIISGMEWCLTNGADVLSMSLGTSIPSDGNSAMDLAVNAAVADGAVAVVAAGNSGDTPGSVGSPGAATSAITVGASAKTNDGLRLAGFSSRGANGVIKPEIVAPGMAIVSAQANSTNLYSTKSGTSMATPFVAGTVALALEANQGLTAADIKSLMMETSIDLGSTGPDQDWGAGLLDGYGFLAAVNGVTGNMAMPNHHPLSGVVATGGLWTGTFTVSDSDLGVPAAVTMLIDTVCSAFLFGACWVWGPDLDVRLLKPNGTLATQSECPLYGECWGVGHQETMVFTPTVAGTYTLEVYPYSTESGAAFIIDVFTGPSGALPPPPPPANDPPVVADDAFDAVEDTLLTIGAPGVLGNDSDPEGSSLSVTSWTDGTNGTVVGAPDGGFSYSPAPDYAGVDTFSYTATDNQGASVSGTVTITIAGVNDAPIATDDVAETDKDTSVEIDVALNDSDPEATLNLASVTTVDGPASGSSVDNGDGTITYTPSLGFVGDDIFRYEICDTDGACSTADVLVSVVDVIVPTGAVHVADLDGSATLYKRGRWQASTLVKIVDDTANAVAGATVTFEIDGRSKACTTDAFGLCTVKGRRLASSVFSTTFVVTGVSADGANYDDSANTDPDGVESDGTTIVISKPT